MPEIISCPHCDRKLRVPDHLLGKKVKCPGCGTMFTGQAAGAEDDVTPKTKPRAAAPREERIEEKPRAARRSVVPPPEDEYEEERPRRRRRDEDEEDEDDRPRSRRRDEEEEDDYDRPRSRRRRDEEEDEDYPRSARADAYEEVEEDEAGLSSRTRQGWRKVRQGINYIILSVWVLLGQFGFSIIGGMVAGIAGASAMSSAKTGGQAVGAAATAGAGVIIVMVIALLIGLASQALSVVGRVFCLNVPPGRGGGLKNLAIASLGLYAGALVFQYLGNIISWAQLGFGAGGSPFASIGSGIAGMSVGGIGALLAIAGIIVFMLFLRAVALAVKARQVANGIKTWLITMAISTGVGILLMIVGFAIAGAAMFSALGGGGGSPPSSGAAAGLAGGALLMGAVGCILGVMALALFIWYVIILFQVRGAIDRYLRRA